MFAGCSATGSPASSLALSLSRLLNFSVFLAALALLIRRIGPSIWLFAGAQFPLNIRGKRFAAFGPGFISISPILFDPIFRVPCSIRNFRVSEPCEVQASR